MTTSLPVPIRWVWLPVVIIWALGAEWARLEGGWPLSWVLADLVPGIVFLIAGQVAWDRRPDTRVGPLMVAISFAWYVGTYGALADPRLGGVAHAFQGYFLALLAWLVLAYPSGRLGNAASRRVVDGLAGSDGRAERLPPGGQPAEHGLRPDQAAEIDRYVRDISLRDGGDAMFAALMAVLAVVVLVLIVRRLMTDTRAGRRVAAPILAGGIALAIGVVVQVAAVAAAGSFAERAFAWDLAQALNIVSLTVVAVGFAFGVARASLARGSGRRPRRRAGRRSRPAGPPRRPGSGAARPLARDRLCRAGNRPVRRRSGAETSRCPRTRIRTGR